MATVGITPDQDAVTAEIFIAAPPERVFQAITDPAQLPRWWGQKDMYRITESNIDLRPRGEVVEHWDWRGWHEIPCGWGVPGGGSTAPARAYLGSKLLGPAPDRGEVGTGSKRRSGIAPEWTASDWDWHTPETSPLRLRR